jgi:hypothetical protein
MGLVVANNVGLSGLVAPKPKVQIITSSTDNIVIPAGSTRVYIEVIGGGGGGGGGRGGDANSGDNGGGGGGGAFARAIFDADALEATLDVIVGTTANAGAGADSSNGAVGSPGNYSEVHLSSAGTVILQAFGGGGGGGAAYNDSADGGGGGGTGTIGLVGSFSAGGDGGDPDVQGSTQGDSLGGRGGAGSQHGRSNPLAGNAEYGGGGGGGRGNKAGSSIFGAGGGGGAGGPEGQGGVWSSYVVGGTPVGSGDQTDGIAGKSRDYGCGDGGSSGWGPHVGLGPDDDGNIGGAGGSPGGGGGAGSGAYNGAGSVGAVGAAGAVRIFSW